MFQAIQRTGVAHREQDKQKESKTKLKWLENKKYAWENCAADRLSRWRK